MKLQHKAWAVVLVVVGLAAFGAMLGARHIVSNAFATLEHDRAHLEGERARRVLDQQLQSLENNARDYAWWGEATAYAEGRNPGFFHSNFGPENMGYLRVSQVMVFDGGARLLDSAVRDPNGQVTSLPAAQTAAARALAVAMLSRPEATASIRTYQVANDRLDLVAAVAIHDPARPEAGPKGALVLVRHLDAPEIERLGEVLMTRVGLAFGLADGVDNDSHVLAGADGRPVLHSILRDYRRQPVAELTLALDDTMAQRGRALTGQGMLLAVLAGLLAAGLLVWLLNRLVLRRLLQLHADLQRVTAEGITPTSRVGGVSGGDEITTLASGINNLLDRVRNDVEEQREAHERQEVLQNQLMQSQKTEALGRLTGGIAHDFNNSLAAITGWVRLAAEDLDTEHPSHEALQQALKASRYADGLMRQLLAFGRQSAPKLRRLHWAGLIEETRQMVASGLTKDCELVIHYRLDDDEVDADPTQLQQVMVNLLINAADAMGGKGRIDLSLDALELPTAAGELPPPGTAELPPGSYLVLAVSDHGPGIDAALKDRVYEPFFTTKGKGRGTGLGLSVAQGIVARHGGAIGLSSVPGEGATFFIYLPASRREAQVPPVTLPGGGVGQGRSILFVDDDQLVRHAWCALLERQGWIVTRSRDGEEAWLQFSQSGKHFDLVLTDQSMPRLDGVGLAQRIRATASPPPIVLMSGHVNEVPADLLDSLFAAVLHKPVEAAELDRLLQEVLQAPPSGLAPL